jgi:hypothetical protein
MSVALLLLPSQLPVWHCLLVLTLLLGRWISF